MNNIPSNPSTLPDLVQSSLGVSIVGGGTQAFRRLYCKNLPQDEDKLIESKQLPAPFNYNGKVSIYIYL